MNQKKCICCIRDKNRFEGSNDFYIFEEYVSNNINFQEVEPKYEIYSRFWYKNTQNSEPHLYEKWYQCRECQKVWRLVTPDPPFAGVWKIVEGKEDEAY